jgi:hypothetical protein
MGIETAALAAYAAIAGTAVTAYSAIKQANVDAPQMPEPQVGKPPEAKTQAAKAPDAAGSRTGSNAALAGLLGGGKAGPTFLTGAAGVDPGSLSLGKSTLLGQ